MEAKTGPMEETGGGQTEDFVRVDERQHVDPLVIYLAAAGVVETSLLAAHLRSCHIDESSLATLDDGDLVEVLQGCKQAGVSVGDRAKLKALVKRTTSNHTYFTVPEPHMPSAPPPSPHQPDGDAGQRSRQQQQQQQQQQPAPPTRLISTFNQLAERLMPLRTGVAEFIDSIAQQYIQPALRENTGWMALWARALVVVVMLKGVSAVVKRRHGSSAFAAFLCGFFIRPRAVAAERPPAEAPSPAPMPL
jgi:hypothetical protein